MTIRSRSEFIINGDIFKVLISLIIPMSIGMFALLVINLVDAFYIGKLGVMELSAISFAFPVLFTLMSFNIGIAIGASASISKLIGQGDFYKAKKTITNIFLLIFVLMFLISIFIVCIIQFKKIGSKISTNITNIIVDILNDDN